MGDFLFDVHQEKPVILLGRLAVVVDHELDPILIVLPEVIESFAAMSASELHFH